MDFLGRVLAWLTDPAHWSGTDGIPTRLGEHLHLSVEAVAIGAAIALPIGIALGHYGRLGNLAISVSNLGRALPSYGILVTAFQVFGLGDAPIILALTALAIPPMVTNSYVALREVDPDIREAARGMGYRELPLVLRIELPLAVPLIMAGIRTSAVQVVAFAIAAAACGGTTGSTSTPGNKGNVTVAGFNFPESSILTELYAQSLAHNGYTVTRKLRLGTREVFGPAIKSGQIDLYPGYAATDLEFYHR